MQKYDLLPPDSAASVLRSGGVVAYPTEAVWGLGCDPRDAVAVRRLLAVKQRDEAQGLILIAASTAQLDPFVEWNVLEATRLDAVYASWPGPNTWLMPCKTKREPTVFVKNAFLGKHPFHHRRQRTTHLGRANWLR